MTCYAVYLPVKLGNENTFCLVKILKYYFVASLLDVQGISSQNAVKLPNSVFNREQVFNSEAPN